jgi:hypothetical protein
MSQPKDKSVDDLHRQVEATKARLYQADEYIKQNGDNAIKIGLSITGVTLEINALMKQMFLCMHNGLPEYDILHASLLKHLNDIKLIADTHFGKFKTAQAPQPAETH